MTENLSGALNEPTELSQVLVHLMKGPLYRDTHEKLWSLLLGLRRDVYKRQDRGQLHAEKARDFGCRQRVDLVKQNHRAIIEMCIRDRGERV